MPSELLPVDPVTEISSPAVFLPPDFLPVSTENLRWQSGENGWWVGVDINLPAAAPAPRSLEQVLSAADFPSGAVLLRTASSGLRFEAPWPFGTDIHWLKETAEGVLRGAAGIRLQSAGQVRLRGQFSGEWIAAVRREDIEGAAGIRVAVWRHSQRGAAAEAALRWSASMEPAGQASVRDMVAALLGIHPLEWVRSLLNELGSRRVEEFAKAAGGSLRALDAVRTLWQSLSARVEAALWPILEQPARWQAFRDFLGSAMRLEDGVPLMDLVRSAMAAAPDHPLRHAADWARAVLDTAGLSLNAPESAGRIREAAQTVLHTLEVDGAENILRALPAAAAGELNPASLGSWARGRLEELFGVGVRMADQALQGAWDEAAGRIAQAAAQAVQKQFELRLAASLSVMRREDAVADATFRLDAEGLAAAARVAAGDLDPLFAGAALLRLRRGLLTDTFARRCFVEVQLPFLRLRRKQKDLASVATAEAAVTEDGRVEVNYRADAADVLATDFRNQTALLLSAALSVRSGDVVRDQFVLSFSDRRALPPGGFRLSYRRVLSLYGLTDVPEPGGPCTAALALRLPGTLAEAWLRAPLPGAATYLPAMGRAALAVQSMAREWLPALYLGSLDIYNRPSAVHPLLAWACSPPSSGPRKRDLTYDFMDPKVLDAVLQACLPAFRERLESVHQTLVDAGRKQTAGYYEPADARYILANVRRQQRNLVALLAADAFLVESVLHLAECARELDRLARTSPRAAVGELARFTREVAETFHRKLRRLYAGDDFLALGPLFFLAATSALADEWGDASRIAAVFTLEMEDGTKRVFSNAAAQRMF
ncbi:MAG: hypothetical protein ACP5VC_17510 [Bryobacteraceae bacterium]